MCDENGAGSWASKSEVRAGLDMVGGSLVHAMVYKHQLMSLFLRENYGA